MAITARTKREFNGTLVFLIEHAIDEARRVR